MRKLLVVATFAAAFLFAGNAMAQSACEGDPNDLEMPNACGPCIGTGGEPGGDTSGCIASCGDSPAGSGCACVGGDASTGQGCVAAQGDDGAAFVCTVGGAPASCDEAQCRAAAQAACGG